MFEQGLIATNPYIRIFLWATALDGILMAVTAEILRRIYCILGRESLVFPEADGVFIFRPIKVQDIASDLFKLRSEIAHGQKISEKFWERRDDLLPFFPLLAYGEEAPRYLELLEEAALSLLGQVLHKICLKYGLSSYLEPKRWRQVLDAR